MNFDPIMYANFLEAEKMKEIREEFVANGKNVDSSGESSDEEAGEKSAVHDEKVEKDRCVRQLLKEYVKNTLALYHWYQFQYMMNIVPQGQEPETLVNSLHNMALSDSSEMSSTSAAPLSDSSEMSSTSAAPPGFPPLVENVPTYLDERNTTVFAAKEKCSTSSTRSMIPIRSKRNLRSKRTLRSQNQPPETECVFCRNNGEPRKIYKSHILRDENKAVVCPKLRSMRCMICGATGSKAHTLKYCPQKPIITPEDLEGMDGTLWRKHRDRRSSVSSTSSNVRRYLRN